MEDGGLPHPEAWHQPVGSGGVGAGAGWEQGRDGEKGGIREGWGGGSRCGTAEQRVVQENGAGAKMSVQVSLFIAPPPIMDHFAGLWSPAPLRCLHFPSAHIQEKARAHLALNYVTSNLYSGSHITDFTPFFSMTAKYVASSCNRSDDSCQL